MKVLIGTGNPGKIAEMALCLREAGLEPVSGAEYPLEAAETGASPEENARLKAAAYCRASGLPAVSFDSGLYLAELPMDDPRQPGLCVRRVGGKRLSDGEMVSHYAALAASLGGRVLCRWVTGYAVCLPDGRTASGNDAAGQPKAWQFYLTDEPCGDPLPGKPLSCISLEGDTGEYENRSGRDGASARRRAAIYRRAAGELRRLLEEVCGDEGD